MQAAPPCARENTADSRKTFLVMGQVMFVLKYEPLTVSKGPLQ